MKNNKFNEFLEDLSYIINILLYNIYYLIQLVFNGDLHEYHARHNINLETTEYNLIKFKFKEINYDTINEIIVDNNTRKIKEDRYIRVFTDKGQLLYDAQFQYNENGGLDNIIISYITDDIILNCSTYTVNTKPWWWRLLWDDTFYMHIYEKDIFGEHKNS